MRSEGHGQDRRLRDFQGRGAVPPGVAGVPQDDRGSTCSCCTTTAAPMAAPTSSAGPASRRNVTLIDWPHAAGQIPAYQDFCANHAARFGWVAFIDLDEFIVPVGGNSIREHADAAKTMRIIRRFCCNGWCSARQATAAARRAGDRELHSTAARGLSGQPAREIAGARQGGDDPQDRRPHIVECQRSHLQHARRNGAVIRRAAGRLPRRDADQPLLHQVARGLDPQACAAARPTRPDPTANPYRERIYFRRRARMPRSRTPTPPLRSAPACAAGVVQGHRLAIGVLRHFGAELHELGVIAPRHAVGLLEQQLAAHQPVAVAIGHVGRMSAGW